ncbi:uncharacterized protein N7518_008977 [Penicillium psychrosexuale]|uniref:uncharacterized protein n=1 Tax=Penicillium psychrosexuale TaxID=1002107 RepID=UPI00254563E2|nr:uncharacterized protein N7518_009856 [Penicillium psychrosexuale]XP_057037560.1 uncharacterized protein N7518_008977 [Penicillium psychrosexuale]KAJ5781373.1 hypothetical protein N7518_009856 [Penicillium psychrosexuale]KAJ5783300.1 hypothetical protein N7518_008977 [Penicillium psychrosexuale]
MTNPTCPEDIKPTRTADFHEILAVAKLYTDAIRTSNPEYIHKSFHKDATMCGHIGPDFANGPATGLLEIMKEKGPEPSLISHLHILSTTPTTAIVEVDAEVDTVGFRDHLCMAKVDGRWQVMTKLYHLYEKKRA